MGHPSQTLNQEPPTAWSILVVFAQVRITEQGPDVSGEGPGERDPDRRKHPPGTRFRARKRGSADFSSRIRGRGARWVATGPRRVRRPGLWTGRSSDGNVQHRPDPQPANVLWVYRRSS